MKPHSRDASDLATWLVDRPRIARAIVWESPQGPVPYGSWDRRKKGELESSFRRARSQDSFRLPERPKLALEPSLGEGAQTTLTEELAWRFYRSYLALSLALEADQSLGWSIAGLAGDQCALLLDSRSLFHWDFRSLCYTVPIDLGAVTPGDPLRILRRLENVRLIGKSRIETICRVLNWCRSNLRHAGGTLSAAGAFIQWQYKGFPPVERILSGTIRLDHAPGGRKHWVPGCYGTTGLIRTLLRTVNIPVRLEVRDDDALPCFVRERLYLSHGDDLYSRFVYAAPPIPVQELLIDETTFQSWFAGPHLSNYTGAKNIGRRPYELGLKHLPDYLLCLYCDDVAKQLPPEKGRVFLEMQRHFSLEELREARLWERLEAKVAWLGCERIQSDWRSRFGVSC